MSGLAGPFRVSFTCLHSPPPLRKDTQTGRESTLEEKRAQHLPLTTKPPLFCWRPEDHARQENPIADLADTPACIPSTTSPLHHTTPLCIPRQHVQLDEQPVSTSCLFLSNPSSEPSPRNYCCSTHWQLAMFGSSRLLALFAVHAQSGICLFDAPFGGEGTI